MTRGVSIGVLSPVSPLAPTTSTPPSHTCVTRTTISSPNANTNTNPKSKTSESPPPCITEIIKGKLYLGNLAAALSPAKWGITHMVSVCLECPSFPPTLSSDKGSMINLKNPRHLHIPIRDSEYENILHPHLGEACDFIEEALADGTGKAGYGQGQGGKVLVHCVMGVSRSVTVVAAHLMKSQHLSLAQSLARLRLLRPAPSPEVRPNYGFLKQLEVFGHCGYHPMSIPSPASPSSLSSACANHPISFGKDTKNCAEHSAYREWRKRWRRDVNEYLECVEDTVEVDLRALGPRLGCDSAAGGGGVLINCNFPRDLEKGSCLLGDLGVTHIVHIDVETCDPGPILADEATSMVDNVQIHRAPLAPQDKDRSIISALPGICTFMRNALCFSREENLYSGGGQVVLVHCPAEVWACVAVGAFLMTEFSLSAGAVEGAIQHSLPLFHPSRTFVRVLGEWEGRLKAIPTSTLSPSIPELASTTTSSEPISTSSPVHTHPASAPSLTALAKSILAEDASFEIAPAFDLRAFGEVLESVHLQASASHSQTQMVGMSETKRVWMDPGVKNGIGMGVGC